MSSLPSYFIKLKPNSVKRRNAEITNFKILHFYAFYNYGKFSARCLQTFRNLLLQHCRSYTQIYSRRRRNSRLLVYRHTRRYFCRKPTQSKNARPTFGDFYCAPYKICPYYYWRSHHVQDYWS